MGITANVPAVPGAMGDKPLPKPKARKCTGDVKTVFAVGIRGALL